MRKICNVDKQLKVLQYVYTTGDKKWKVHDGSDGLN